MYTIGDVVEDFTTGNAYVAEIKDADENVICHVLVLASGVFPHRTLNMAPAEKLIERLNAAKAVSV